MDVMIALALCLAFWIVVRIAWHVSAARKTSLLAQKSVAALVAAIRECEQFHKWAESKEVEQALTYASAKRLQARQAYTVEDLREVGAKNIRWGAILDAGARTLEDILRLGHAGLSALPGVGAASAERLLGAAKVAVAVIEARPLPLPDPSNLRPEDVAFVAAVARASESRREVRTRLARIGGEGGELAKQSDVLEKRTTIMRWLFEHEPPTSTESLVGRARHVLEACRGQLESESLSGARNAMREIDARWGIAALDAGELPGQARAAAGELAEEMREVLACVPGARPTRGTPTAVQVLATTRRAQPSPDSRSGAPAETMKAPAPRAARGSAQWVPAGQTVEVQGYRIGGGMVYVGESIAPIARHGMDDPALINPRMPVDRRRPDRAGELMTYWPWYSQMPPASRAAYLEWLAGGRREPSAYIGYVFLFFYGLERRVLCDASTDPAARGEIGLVVEEVARLLGIYGGNGSFRGYATGFLDAIRARDLAASPLYSREPARFERSFELPLELRIALGQLVAEARPIPANWALAWVTADASTYLRTPAQRCPEEFARLFALRYAAKYGEGMRIPRNRRTLTFSYKPASAAFPGPVEVGLAHVPDVAGLSAPVQKLRDLADECSEALAPYSRWIGRHPDDRGSPAAAATLPPELAAEAGGQRIDAICNWAARALGGQRMAPAAADELIALWAGTPRHRLAKPESVMLAQFLERRGFGMEPDARFGPDIPEPEGQVVVFRHEGEVVSAPSRGYAAVATLLRLGSVLAGADGAMAEEERAYLEGRLEDAADLSASERGRLRAHLTWLGAAKVGTTGLKRRVSSLGQQDRSTLGEFLVSVAAADGRIEPQEIKSLLRLFPLLGLAADEVYASLHRFGLADASASAAPVVVRPGSPDRSGYAIPAMPDRTATVTLDPEKVQAKLKEAETVFGILQDVFSSEEPLTAAPVADSAPGLWGLDAAHSALMRQLVAKSSWSRAEFENLSAGLSLLPDGAIETINDAAFEACGDSLIDGDDPISIQVHLLKERAA